MKRKIYFIILFITILSYSASAEEPIRFDDANLKAAIEETLGITYPTPTDMLNLTSFSCYGREVVDITGLEHATNLVSLNLFNNQISDISVLTGLTNLRRLYLARNQISDISAVAGLTKLTELNLWGNQFSDISVLAGLTNLKTLHLNSNEIIDISALTSLTKLTSLRLNQNQISDISALVRLKNLTELDLWNNQISDISVLAGMTDLVDLSLGGNQISDISVLSNLTKLTDLGLFGNQISDISVLAGLKNLTILELNNNQISNISVLAYLTNLTSLRLGNNQFTDISALARLTYIERLWLENMQISDISVLARMTDLVILNLYSNQISDISVLADKMKLQFLYLLDNPLSYDAVNIYIPRIRRNNPGIDIHYDPYEPQIYEPRKVFVDDDGPNDPVPYDSANSDPSEDGTHEHPFDTIQEGIDTALDGEIVFVQNGTYTETINFSGKNITVTGFNPEEPNAIGPFPILDAGYISTAVIFENEEEPNCTLEGFVITRGMGDIAGAISCLGSSPTISNCLIVGNRAIDPNGGGAAFCTDSNATFKSCTFSGNYGGPQGAGLSIQNSNVKIVNSILWDNYTEIFVASGSLPSVTYSDIKGGWQGTAIIDEPPLFDAPGYWTAIEAPDVQVEPSDPNAVWIDGDYHLLSEFGRYRGRSRWDFDEVTSPCIDFGHPSFPLGQEPSPNGGIINIGAYGATSQASKSSPIQEPVYFADAELKAFVELLLDVNDPTPTDMLALNELDSRIRNLRIDNVSDLTGLEYAKNLSHLWLSYKQIADISALASLTKLEWVVLDNNKITDISALSELKNLTHLDLQGNPLNQQAYDIYIPQIRQNNPYIDIQFDP